MSRSRRDETAYNFPHRREVRFDPEKLKTALFDQAPPVLFACLTGSAQDGVIPQYSDLDLAVYVVPDRAKDWSTLSRIIDTAENVIGNTAEVDLGIMNTADAIFRHQALQGKILLVRPEAEETFAEFYTRTCREYEEYQAILARWRRYRGQVA